MEETLKRIFRLFGLEHFGRYYGIYKGFVSDNDDPEGMGRLKLSVPEVYGNGKTYDYWAFPKGMYAGDGYGQFVVPEKGDAVWVQFENGDSRFPVWEFGWFGKGEAPEGASPSVKMFKTPSGHTVIFDDATDKIEITKSNGVKIVLQGNEVSIPGAQSVPNMYGGLTCIPVCPFIGYKHSVDKTLIG